MVIINNLSQSTILYGYPPTPSTYLDKGIFCAFFEEGSIVELLDRVPERFVKLENLTINSLLKHNVHIFNLAITHNISIFIRSRRDGGALCPAHT